MDYYKKLRDSIRSWSQSKDGKQHIWAEYLLLAPDLFHLLTRLSFEKAVPATEKVKIVAAMTYFVMPFDLLPEAMMGAAGLVDDVAISLYVVHGLLNQTPRQVVEKHWSGEDDLLVLSKRVVKTGESLVGGKLLWEKLKKSVPSS